jgi:hypothetical protein
MLLSATPTINACNMNTMSSIASHIAFCNLKKPGSTKPFKSTNLKILAGLKLRQYLSPIIFHRRALF